MNRLIKRLSKKKGLKPGALVYVGERHVEETRITVIDYDATELREVDAPTAEEALTFRDTNTLTWINVTGLHDVEVVRKIGLHYGLHELVLEDILNVGHRPKLEESEDHVFVALKMIYNNDSTNEMIAEQVSIVWGKNFVLSFQERQGDVFDFVRKRIRKTVPRVRFVRPDYLAYALIDAIVDGYFGVLEGFGDRIEDMEAHLIDNSEQTQLESIHAIKRELVLMRKWVWPMREVVGGLDRTDTKLIHKESHIYIRDLYEHTIQVIDTVETFRDMASGLLDTYLTSVSNRMNEVMKVLTIIATIFIPLSFLAGVYGMNFDPHAGPFNMPELSYRYGYMIFWIIALVIGGGLFLFFRRKRWL